MLLRVVRRTNADKRQEKTKRRETRRHVCRVGPSMHRLACFHPTARFSRLSLLPLPLSLSPTLPSPLRLPPSLAMDLLSPQLTLPVSPALIASSPQSKVSNPDCQQRLVSSFSCICPPGTSLSARLSTLLQGTSPDQMSQRTSDIHAYHVLSLFLPIAPVPAP